MPTFISQTEIEKQVNKFSKKFHYVGEIYPEIFSVNEKKELSELKVIIIYFGKFKIDSNVFCKIDCPICKKQHSLVPYNCCGSVLSNLHTILFYCENCKESFVTNDYDIYFKEIKNYIMKNNDFSKNGIKYVIS